MEFSWNDGELRASIQVLVSEHREILPMLNMHLKFVSSMISTKLGGVCLGIGEPTIERLSESAYSKQFQVQALKSKYAINIINSPLNSSVLVSSDLHFSNEFTLA